MTQAIVDRLLAEDDIEDVGAGSRVAIQRRRYRAACLTPHFAVRLAEPDQRLLERQMPPVQVDADARAQLFEQPVPGGVADRAEVGEHALLGLGQLVRAKLPRLLDEVAISSRVRVGVETRCLLVADLRQLQGEEDAVPSALGTGLTHASQQPARRVVIDVLAVQEVGVDLRLGGQLLVFLELAHHGREIFGRKRHDPALVARFERLRSLERLGERHLDSGIGRRLEEVGQVPTDMLRAGGLDRLRHGPSGYRLLASPPCRRSARPRSGPAGWGLASWTRTLRNGNPSKLY